MRTYSQFAPTGFDNCGLGMPDRQSWLVVPCGRNRDSDCLAESNWLAALSRLGGESDTVEIHRFGHWACGWFEIMIVQPGTPAAIEAESIEDSLSNYPILDESDLGEREMNAANETWQNCFNAAERIAYIRRHASQFEFSSFADMLSCVRGKHFAGYASELIGG